MKDTPDYTGWLTTTQVARKLEVGTAYVIQHLIPNGDLTEIVVTPLGRLFNPEEVEFLRQQRAQAKAETRAR